ncbi:aldehyde dehydrogenase [Pseudomonas taiwanensis]|uniref:aldehyde dehydrogenase family protein n=1 Tax=Pseudomonas taiwanensis TaxID=470150 RepID=UPI0015BEE32B|nr:aldehyde dehydrogenase family protein [Pseudomonas taiwanensis]NWL80428.1 aldehyde dehydrogenase [Pseudomonas taiwanensis]
MSEPTLYIDGRWVAPRQGQRFSTVDPALEKRIMELGAAGAEDVDLAVKAARTAFNGGWAQMPGSERAGYLNALADNLELRKETLAGLEVRDNGKPLLEAEADVADAIECFRHYARLACELDERQEQLLHLRDKGFSCRIRHEPLGVVGLIIHWSFPLLMAARAIAPVLAAGATCVVVPSELTPLSALELGLAASRVGLPPGVLNILSGFEGQVDRALVRHPGVDRLSFGRLPFGVKMPLTALVGERRLSPESGGKAGCILFDDIDVDAAVEGIVHGAFLNQGQASGSISRLVVQASIAPRLLERLVESVRGMRVGHGMEAGVHMGPLVSARQHRKFITVVQHGQRATKLLIGGRRPAHLPVGHFVEATIFDEPDVRHEIWREDVLGPVICVKRFKTEAEALALLNHDGDDRATAVFSADLERATRIANGLRAGTTWVNCSPSAFTPEPSGLESYLERKQIIHYDSAERWGWYPR